MEHIITNQNFDEIISSCDAPILVDFWASWCGPCMMLAPLVEKLSETHHVGKVNVDEEPELARRFGIMSIPTLLVFKNGTLVNRSMGYQPLESLQKLLEV